MYDDDDDDDNDGDDDDDDDDDKSEITILTICNFFLEAAMRRAGNNPTDVEVSDIVNRWD